MKLCLLLRNPCFLSPLVAGLLLVTSSFAQTPPAPVDLSVAKSLIRQNEFAAAERLLRSDLGAPTAETLYLLAYVLHRQNKPRDSLAFYTQAAALKPPTAEDLRIVAIDYVLLSDYPDAIHWLDRSVAADPRNAEAWYALGRAHMEQGDFIAAERNLRRVLALVPTDSKALDNLGLSLEAQNRTDDALLAYQQAIAAQKEQPTLNRRSEQPFLNLGTLLNAKARSAEAIAPLAEAITLTPTCPRCHEELARALVSTHQDQLAAEQMALAVALDPKNPRFHYQLGQIYRRSGLTEKADAEFKLSAGLYGSHSTPTDQ